MLFNFKQKSLKIKMIFKCICGKEFSTRKELINHISDRMLIKYHKCPLFGHQPRCNYKSQFDSITQLRRHLVTHEDGRNQQLSNLMHTPQHLIDNSVSNNYNDGFNMEDSSYTHKNDFNYANS